MTGFGQPYARREIRASIPSEKYFRASIPREKYGFELVIERDTGFISIGKLVAALLEETRDILEKT